MEQELSPKALGPSATVFPAVVLQDYWLSTDFHRRWRQFGRSEECKHGLQV